MAWTLRRSPGALAAAALAALAVLVPSYAWFGWPAVHALTARRDGLSADSFYHALLLPALRPHLALIATVLVIAVAALTLRRLPEGVPGRPAVRAALALSVAWLFLWPYQFPWYDTMIICVLVLYPASRLDWLVLARVAAATTPNIPGNPGAPLGPFLGRPHYLSVAVFTPLLLFGAAAGLVWLCLSGNWKLRGPGEPPYELTPQSAGVGRRIGPAPMACNTIAVTTGLVGSWPWLIRSSGQIDWMGTLIAPASRADAGGVTTWSSVVHSDIQRGRCGTGVASSPASRLLPGTSCWHATGHAPGTNPAAPAAIRAPWYGEPRVITRRALAGPSSWRAHSSATTPPAE